MKEMIYDDGNIKGWIYNRLDTDKYYLYVAEEGKRWRKSLKTNNLINAKMKVNNIMTSYKNGVYDVPQFKDIATDFLKFDSHNAKIIHGFLLHMQYINGV